MKNILSFLCCLAAFFQLFSQSNINQNLSVNATGALPDSSAQLDVSATDKGLLVPRLSSAQRSAIPSPATGLLVFDLDTNSFWFYSGAVWTEIARSYTAGSGISIVGATIGNLGDVNAGDDLTFGSAAGGSLNGAFPNPTVAANAIGSAEIDDGSITGNDLAPGVIPSSLPPSGSAGGDLAGTYPNPTIGANAIGSSEITDATITTTDLAFSSLPPNGAAGGDLTGTYPNPTIGTNAIGSTEITNGSITTSDLAFTALPPNGAAGGDLSGAYPNPDIAASAVGTNELANTSVTSAKISSSGASNGQLLTANGSGGAAWLSPAVQTKIQDADTDTKIQVEESTDEDIIRFDLGGTEKMVLKKNTSGVGRLELLNTSNNLFVGENAGAANSTGANNTALGKDALLVNTTGSQNTAIGARTLIANTTGNDNVAVGREAMMSNTSGYNNTAIGEGSLRANTEGVNNTALGNTSLRNNTTGSQNTASGLQALYANTTGSGNTANGFNALTANQSASNNTAFGEESLLSNTTGASNTAVGGDALRNNTTGNNNTALGQGAGLVSTGSGNVFIGADAGAQETGSDKLYIDNSNSTNPLIFGNFSSNRVGINTNSPSATLHVEGSVAFSSSTFAFYANDGVSGDCENIGCSTSTSDVSVFASARVRASEFNAFSDARIKRIRQRSDPATDLAILTGLKVTDYHYVDVVGKGSELKKGFIAQEVEQVFPEAVSKSKDFVPNIYRLASAVRFDAEKHTLTIMLDELPAGALDIQRGDKVRIFSTDTFEKIVIAVSGSSFTVADWTEKDTKQVFVFGKEVEDFRNVDYDRIFTLNVGAVQALASKVESLEAQNAALMSQLENQALQLKQITAALRGAGIAVEK